MVLRCYGKSPKLIKLMKKANYFGRFFEYLPWQGLLFQS